MLPVIGGALLIAAAVLAGGALLGWLAGRGDDAPSLDKGAQAH